MNKAVSLLELTIVLTIIALLITSFSSGANLLHNAKVNKVIAQSQEIISGVSAFKATYNELPGDFSNAYRFLGGTSCASSQAICDGDGDDLIEADSAGSNQYEQAIAMKHLALANIINSKCNSEESCSTIDPTNITDGYVILSEINNSVILARFYNNVQSQQWGNIGLNYLQIGAKKSNGYLDDPFLRPTYAEKIDRKLDDAVAGTGIVTPHSGHGTCCVGDNCNTGNYKLTSDDILCGIVYGFGAF